MLDPSEAENILQAWGRHLLHEIETEVGYPSRAAVVGQYEAPPEWEPPPPGPLRPGDIDRACWVMIVMSSRYRRLHRDMRDHYRDGARLGYQRLTEGRVMFSRLWEEWSSIDLPKNAI